LAPELVFDFDDARGAVPLRDAVASLAGHKQRLHAGDLRAHGTRAAAA